MFRLFGCKHKRVASKFVRTPRYDQEAEIKYTYCEDCGKILKCRTVLVPPFAYPKPEPKVVPVPEKPVVKETVPQTPVSKGKSRVQTAPVIIKQSPKTEKPKPVVEKPILPGESFVKQEKKRNVGRKPSAPTAPTGTSLASVVKAVYNKPKDSVKSPVKIVVEDDLAETYGKFEDDDDDEDDDIQVVRKESPEEAEHRFQRARRRQRKA